jgi:hypothetical protein
MCLRIFKFDAIKYHDARRCHDSIGMKNLKFITRG